jgi:ESS family glutamate:Na+ symporter
MQLELNRVWTIVIAIACIELGKRLNRKFIWLEKGNIPPAVSAGLLISLLLAGLRSLGWLDLSLDPVPRDALLLVFFASLGFGAHLGKLASAGKGTLVICIAILALIFTQNLIGVGMAKVFGHPEELGLFCGSIAFLGGHGTAVAWANTDMAISMNGAFELGVGSATLGLVLGGLVAGPVSMFLSKRGTQDIVHATVFEKNAPVKYKREHVFSSDRWLICLLFVLACVAIGLPIREWLNERGTSVPPFLAVMLIAVVITNIADFDHQIEARRAN